MRHDPFAKKDPLKSILIVVISVLVTGSVLYSLGKHLEIDFISSIGHTIIISGCLWMMCRSYVQFLWRRYPWEQFPVKHIVLEVVGITTFTMIFGFTLYTIELRLNIFLPDELLWLEILVTLLITYLITGIHEMIYFYRQWIMNFSRSVRLEKDSIEAKYEILKTQINPHFLFNSLNSLTSIVDDNPRAVDYIQDLSEFLRYILGSRDKDLVYLRDELKVLNHYYKLQKSRFQDNLLISLDIPEKYHLYTLPPLVLQMLVENCIKHNIISSEKPLKISISASNDSIFVKNNLQRKRDVVSTGQGLRNISERYRYFTRKESSIKETKNEYIVSMPLLIVEL
ncbi:MAG: histidine kinase [Bacteroidales bacterium]|nr:histidine kinase [Bacteroidales bacterium]